jgi:hypothetical protein
MPTKTTKPVSTRRPSTRAPKMNDVMTSSSNGDGANGHGVSAEAIAKRAFELFVERGCEHGHHEEDWLRAEQELRSSSH